MSDPLEEEMKRLARLPENRTCANCDVEARCVPQNICSLSATKYFLQTPWPPQSLQLMSSCVRLSLPSASHICPYQRSLGHSSACMPFRIFVCGTCKSALQAYSHRVKSLSQSTFTAAEVDSFKPRAGGGNDAARRTWMGRLPPGDVFRPRAGDDMSRFKAFVVRVYEERAYYVPPSAATEAGGVVAVPRPVSMHAPSTAAPALDVTAVKGRWGTNAHAPAAAVSAPAVAQAAAIAPAPAPPEPAPAAVPLPASTTRARAPTPEVDLLGFGSSASFGIAPTSSPALPTVDANASGFGFLSAAPPSGLAPAPAAAITPELSPSNAAAGLSAAILGAYQPSQIGSAVSTGNFGNGGYSGGFPAAIQTAGAGSFGGANGAVGGVGGGGGGGGVNGDPFASLVPAQPPSRPHVGVPAHGDGRPGMMMMMMMPGSGMPGGGMPGGGMAAMGGMGGMGMGGMGMGGMYGMGMGGAAGVSPGAMMAMGGGAPSPLGYGAGVTAAAFAGSPAGMAMMASGVPASGAGFGFVSGGVPGRPCAAMPAPSHVARGAAMPDPFFSL